MNEHEQNIAIAKLLPELLTAYMDSIYWNSDFRDVIDSEWLYVIHEAEKLIFTTPAKRTQYYWQLLNVIGRYTSPDTAISATYPQRREALLRTLKLWKES